MNINLHNYEEFFLLYADKELSQQDRFIVEQFIKDNPELEEEFTMINSTVIEPDENFQLQDKSFLLKSSKWINEENYEEIFVLYHDSELTEDKKDETLEFLKIHPELKEEFEFIGQAKISAEAVIFPDKQSLIRKEKSGIPGRIILFRSLAAAAVLAFGIWWSFPYFTGGQNSQPVAMQPNTPDNAGSPSSGIIFERPKDEQIASVKKQNPKTERVTDKTQPNAIQSIKKIEDVPEKNEKIILAKNDDKRSNLNQTEEKKQYVERNKNKEGKREIMIAQIPHKDISAGLIDRSEISHVDIDVTPRVTEQNNHVQNAVHIDVDKESSGNYLFYNVPAEELKKTKIGGFLKKIKRVAERNDPVKRFFEKEVGEVVSNK